MILIAFQLGHTAGSSAAAAIAGPYSLEAGEVFQAGAVAGEVFQAGHAKAETFQAGSATGEVI